VDLSNIVAEFTLSTGATATVDGAPQISGATANDFTSPVTYEVTSGDGETAFGWTVTITKKSTGGEAGEWVKVANPAFGGKSTVNGVAYGNGKWVAVGSNSEMAYSTDGVNWTAVANTGFTKTHPLSGILFSINSITYGGGKFVAVGDANQMAYSTDGINWTAVANTAILSSIDLVEIDHTKIQSIVYGDGKFVAGGWCQRIAEREEHGAQMSYSTDGINWTAIDANIFGFGSDTYYTTNSVYSITYANGKFVAGGLGVIAHSTDGVNWTTAPNPFRSGAGQPFAILDIAYGGGKYVAVGQNRKMAYSTDAANWTEIAGNPFGTHTVSLINGVAYGNGRFYAGSEYGDMRTSTDGITWQHVDMADASDSHLADIFDGIRDITYGDGKFVAVGINQENATTVSPVIAYSND
jgi:hypothetical protein